MSEPVAPRALFLCDGAVRPPDLASPVWGDPIVISTRGDDPELSLVLEGLARKVVGDIDPRARDLVRIAACCYAADLRVRRGGVDVHRERWRRGLALCLPVAEPAFWADPDVTARLEEALGFGTEDTWIFRFEAGLRGEEGQLRVIWAEAPPPPKLDTVILFSGGADSLCALVEALRQGATPAVVSHWPAQHIRSRQDTLLHDVKERFQTWDVPHASFKIHRRGKAPVESSQRSRGFLYATLGAAIAAHHGVGEVRFADNGYVSVNPPISDQLVGALASRGTHPKFLHLVNRLLERVFPGVRVVNPLWNRTRAQALRVLAEAGCADLLGRTFTCGKQQGHEAGRPLCGGCSQCVDRRIAVVAAGLEEHDPIGRYELDLFTGALREGEPRTVALDFVRFAWETRGLTSRALYDRLPQLDDCLIPDDPDFASREAGIAQVLLDHAEETMTAVGAMTTRLGTDLAQHRLPATSLLPLWIGGKSADARTEEATGSDAPAASDARFGVSTIDEGASFLRQGETWIVKFRGQIGHYKTSLGITQLTHLLEHPGQELDIVALSDCRAVPRVTGGDRDGMATGIGRSLGPILTPDAKRNLERRRDELPELINAARAAGRLERVRELRDEQKAVTKVLRTATGLGGRPREFGGPEDQARKRLSRNVHGCYARMRHAVPLFVAHAEQFVHLGIPPRYAPDPPERWLIQR